MTRASIVEAVNDGQDRFDGLGEVCIDHPMLVGILDTAQKRCAARPLEACLFEPIRDLLRRPSKEIRSQLVRLGARIAAGNVTGRTRRNLDIAVEAVEMLHAGSLIVDDIEDGSPTRRGGRSIHHIYGVPVALNAANWLYFWPAHLIGNIDLAADAQLELYQRYHRTLLRAHFGQAIDVGVDIEFVEQRKVKEVCLLSMELKTGTLTAFALGMGALLGGFSDKALVALDVFGRGFGVALQMFDDLGNLKAASGHKRFEDLALRRPSWVWAMAAECSSRDYREFVQAVRALPDHCHLERWLEKTKFHLRAAARARDHVVRICRDLEESVPFNSSQRKAFMELRRLGLRVAHAYG
jgi:geranylgeranyl pyrophosphate synthase